MSGDVQVRFCEQMRGRFPRLTRRNVYVGSITTGQRVMGLLRRCYDRLKLMLNGTKSAVVDVIGRKFLGYSFWVGPKGQIKLRVADKAMKAFKHRIRQLTRRSYGQSLSDIVERLRSYLLGWEGYIGLAQTPGIWRRLDEWLRAIQLKHWKRGKTMYRELKALGASPKVARRIAANSRRWWRNSAKLLNSVLTVAYFERMGLPRLS